VPMIDKQSNTLKYSAFYDFSFIYIWEIR
jgi:hypothetical protein